MVRFIDPPMRLFSTNQDWLDFLKEMLKYPNDEQAKEQVQAAIAELELRGVDFRHLTSA